MRASRKDEQGSHPPFRSKRLYGANAHWYFDAREGMQSGPFSNQDEARKALAMFVAQNVFAGTEQGFSRDDRPAHRTALNIWCKKSSTSCVVALTWPNGNAHLS
jgi:hypothetical protein